MGLKLWQKEEWCKGQDLRDCQEGEMPRATCGAGDAWFSGMARGWESKSVESQQHESELTGKRQMATQEERERQAKRESLEMSRGRITRELASARTETHRAALENALRYLEDELRKA